MQTASLRPRLFLGGQRLGQLRHLPSRHRIPTKPFTCCMSLDEGLLQQYTNLNDAESLAEELSEMFQGDLMTEAWAVKPSRFMGQRPDACMTYAEGVRRFLGQGSIWPETVNEPISLVVKNKFVKDRTTAAGSSDNSNASLEERCIAAVDATMLAFQDVESHLSPKALASVLVQSPVHSAAVHLAALANSAWKRVPSRVLGTRPEWASDAGWGWTYGQLMLLTASVGPARVKVALKQPCKEMALALLQASCAYHNHFLLYVVWGMESYLTAIIMNTKYFLLCCCLLVLGRQRFGHFH